MTRGKDLKRRVRVRMQKTGESYTAARAHVVRKPRLQLPDNYEALAGKRDALIAEKTGRDWPRWVEALDAIGATGMQHGDIARWVHEQTGLGWWSQTVAVGYERIRGMRDVGQRMSGTYEVSKSRTFAIPAATLFDAFANDRIRRRWLDADITIRKATPHRTLRITWPDGTDVHVYLTEKGETKSAITIQHGKLASREAADEAKALWTERLGKLAQVVA
jgi:uncharacterized protein YndB with AHSA1/START domain